MTIFHPILWLVAKFVIRTFLLTVLWFSSISTNQTKIFVSANLTLWC